MYLPHSNHHEVPPSFSKNRGHLSEHRIKGVTEPGYTTLKHQEDGVGVPELVVQHVNHLLYVFIHCHFHLSLQTQECQQPEKDVKWNMDG